MKRRIVLMACALFVGCSHSSHHDVSGNEGPNGGDATAQKAAELAEDVYATVSANRDSFPEIPLDQLDAAIHHMRLLTRDHTYAHGQETDAVNNGKDLIELNASRWIALREEEKMALLLHEILGLIGLEKDSYAISNRLLSVTYRFLNNDAYSCSVDGRDCSVSMYYDQTQQAFAIRDSDCGNFPSPLTLMVKEFAARYVTPIPPACTPEGECKAGSVDPGKWNTVNFLDGRNFYFTGNADKQLQCSPASAAAADLEIAGDPEKPIVISPDFTYENPDGSKTVVTGPWFQLILTLRNQGATALTVAALVADVTSVEGNTQEVDIDLSTVELAPGASRTLPRLYVDKLPPSISTAYQVKLKILGWTGTTQAPLDRFEKTIDLVTQ